MAKDSGKTGTGDVTPNQGETSGQPVYHHSAEDDRPIRFIGDLFTIKADTNATRGAYSLTETLVSPKAEGPPPHHHDSCEEAFYIASGQLDFVVDGESLSAKAGSFVVVPRGAAHVYSNPLPEPARVLVMISPPGFEKEFERMGEFADE
ncbi:MAG: cupin domain-containing protein [Myxococcota bacterium]